MLYNYYDIMYVCMHIYNFFKNIFLIYFSGM